MVLWEMNYRLSNGGRRFKKDVNIMVFFSILQ